MKYLKMFENFEAKDLDSITTSINDELEKKNLKGMPATNINNPQDDIAKNNVDYVTFKYKTAEGSNLSVWLKNTPDNQTIAKEIQQKHGGEYTSIGQGRYVGVTISSK